MYDCKSLASIISYATELKGYSLREKCGGEIEDYFYKGKGIYGQILEKYYFGYEPNSSSKPDFEKVGLELKSSPLKKLKKNEYRSKERLVLNIINYLEVVKEEFYESSFYKKNKHLLLVFYYFEKEKNILDYIIKLVGDWKYSSADLKIIKRDWGIINKKIEDGRAHELSEGDTLYLGACTKGSTAEKSLRDQPFSEKKAKQRAYSLKQGYVNHMIASIAKDEDETYGRILDHSQSFTEYISLEEIVVSKFKLFYGKTPEEILKAFNVSLNNNAKNYLANISKIILGLDMKQKIEEFEKADIHLKTIRLNENNLPKENISFKAFKYSEIIKTNWEDSNFREKTERKFFFVFYKFERKILVLKRVLFWNMPYSDILESEKVWKKTVDIIRNGDIVKEVTQKGVRKTNFPKSTENNVAHVRPHAKNNEDTYPLPISDKLTLENKYTKHSFWLNRSYIKDEIYLKK